MTEISSDIHPLLSFRLLLSIVDCPAKLKVSFNIRYNDFMRSMDEGGMGSVDEYFVFIEHLLYLFDEQIHGFHEAV